MSSSNEEVEKLKVQLNNWKEKVFILRNELEETQAEFKHKLQFETQVCIHCITMIFVVLLN